MADKKTDNFMRSLCTGEILEEAIFPYPEIKSEEKETLKATFDAYAKFFKGRESEQRKWDEVGEFPPEVFQTMRDLGLFGVVIPEKFGGFGFSSMAYSRTMQELARYDGSFVVTIGAHSSIGMRGLLLFGTDAQKEKYLPKLASGEWIACFCLTEPGSGSDAASIKTTAKRVGNEWVLNGEKLWITNGGIADFFTVFAKTEGEGDSHGKITAFIVTKDMGGVSASKHEDKMGLRASSTTSVYFENVRLKDEHVIGEVGKGFKVAMHILNTGRTGIGGGSVGGMKAAIAMSTKQAKARVQFGKPIAEFGLIKQKIGHMVVDCYATESVVGMIAGLIDSGYTDYAVEAAISKVFASEALWRTCDEALQIAAGNGFMKEFPYERMLRDARINRIFEGTNEILRLFIALTAIHDVGAQLKDVAKSLQDPIKGFGVLSEYAKKRMTHATGYGKATMSKAHPTIGFASSTFEDGARQLAAACDRLLRKHGKEMVDKQFASRRLGDIMIDLFVLASTISRVTQTIERQGVDKTQREVQILKVFSGQVGRRVRGNFGKIDDNDDDLIESLAHDACERESYSWDLV